MALVKCKECGKEVSNKASACPHCGFQRRFSWRNVVLGLAVAAAVGITASFLASGNASHSDEGSLTPGAVVKPNRLKAFEELYGVPFHSDKVRVAPDRVAKFWFDKAFEDSRGKLYAVFIQEQRVEANGELSECHACTVAVSAITYRHKDGKWSPVAKQREFIGEIGSWGRAPNAEKNEDFKFSSNGPGILIEESWSGHGITNVSKAILGFEKDAWIFTGSFSYAGDNKGEECVEHEAKRPESDENECWSFNTKLSIEPPKGEGYAAIIATRTGSYYSPEQNKILAATSQRYVFSGKEYTESKGAVALLSTQSLPDRKGEGDMELATKKLSYCLLPKAQYGQYSSHDGGKSAQKLLERECTDEYLGFVKSCISKENSKEKCVTVAAIHAQVAIKSFNK